MRNQKIIDLFEKLTSCGKYEKWRVFEDFLFLTTAALSNSSYHEKWKEREDEYLAIIKNYSKEETNMFAQLLAELYLEITKSPRDVLGEVFHDMELHNKWKGQFFTPYHIASFMAEISIDLTSIEETIKKNGCIKMLEPCCGSGAMCIAYWESIKKHITEPQKKVIINCVDLDLRCVYMCYIQLSLLNIPAIVYHGDSLSNEMFDYWITPTFVEEDCYSKI